LQQFQAEIYKNIANDHFWGNPEFRGFLGLIFFQE